MCILCNRAYGADIFIISSSDIIPYNRCIDAIKENLSEYSLRLSNIEGNIDNGQRILASEIKENPELMLILAVGPQAAFILSKEQTPLLGMFCMVLNPVKLLSQNRLYPGISLNIPPELQIEAISTAFPKRKKIGIFYDKHSNQQAIERLYNEAKKRGSTVTAFPISSANDIPGIINSKKFSIDVLLIIPDRLIKKKKIVQYIIKESLKRKIPVAGYNSWFAENGAMLSFVIGYSDIGKQAGIKAKTMLLKHHADSTDIVPPDRIKISINLKIAKKLGITISRDIIQRADEVIE